MEREFICCICKRKFRGWGNNPDGAAWKKDDGKIIRPSFDPEARCCDDCNLLYVIPGRLMNKVVDK